MRNRNNYVIDTSVFAHDPQVIREFKGNDVIIPIAVLDELDKIKKLSNAAGKNARITIRLLDEICAKANVTKPIRIENNINLRIDSKEYKVTIGGDANYGDNKILTCAQAYKTKFKDRETIIVSRDINLRIRAKSIGLGAQNYEKGTSNLTDLYTGYQTIVDTKMGVTLRETGMFDLQGSKLVIQPNECIQINDASGTGIAIGRRIGDRLRIIQNQNPWGLEAKNREQSFAINMLLDPKLPLVSLIGLAGSGKTLLSIGSALEMVMERKKFEKLIVYRPIQPMGNDIGYLPGSMSEKLEPWMGAVMDSFEYLFSSKSKEKWQVMMDMYCEKGRIEMNALTYIRGRSIPNAMIIIDECFPYDQDIATEFGKQKIGKLVDKWKNGEQLPLIKSFNETTNSFEYQKITNAWSRGVKPIIEVHCSNRIIRCTDNHKFLTTAGWKEAGNLMNGDLIKTSEPGKNQILRALNSDQEQIILGSFLGDGNLSNHGTGRYRLRVTHGTGQREYCEWKASMFDAKSKQIERNGYAQKQACRFVSKMFALDHALPITKTNCPQWVLDKLDARGLAIWFMDDGTTFPSFNGARIATCSFDKDSHIRMVNKLSKFGIDCKYEFYNGNGYINISDEGFITLCDLVAPYIHKNIAYKFNVEDSSYHWNGNFLPYGLTVVDRIVDNNECKEVYDIEIDKNHNFIVCSKSNGKNATNNGLIAHNCQNLSKDEVKTILTRAGYGTKIVLTGDIEQIDSANLDAINNGLTYVVEKFKTSELAGHVTFSKGERSPLATEAATIL